MKYPLLAALLIVMNGEGLILADNVTVTRHAVIRTGPSSSASSLGTAEAGAHFGLVSSQAVNGWLHIQYPEQPAWIYSKSVSVSASAPTTDSIRVASFNVLHLGWGTSKDIPLLTQVLSQFDLVALLEVMPNAQLDSIQSGLDALTGSTWHWVQSAFVGTSKYKESYVFMWREDRVHEITGSEFLVEDAANNFERDPYASTFKARNFDFTLIALHSIWGDSQTQRRAEARAAARVFQAIQDEDGSENDVILLGDFNLPPSDSGWDVMKSLPSITALMQPPTLTTVSETGLSSLYDNLWFQQSFVREYSGRSGVYNFPEEMFEGAGRFSDARAVISDHLPVWAEFNISSADDD